MIPLVKPTMPDAVSVANAWEEMSSYGLFANNYRYVPKLEAKLQEYLNIRSEVTCVANGTMALMLALAQNATGKYIVTTPFTAPATIQAIKWMGYQPILADIDPDTWNITTETIDRVTLAGLCDCIVPVHLFGNPCDPHDIPEDVRVVYDGAHAFGVEVNGKSVFDFYSCSICSFHATKTFSTVEGGAVFSHDTGRAYRQLRNFGIDEDNPDFLHRDGTNAKMSEIHAAIGLLNLETWKDNREIRKVIWEYYRTELGTYVKLQKINSEATSLNYSYMPIVLKTEEERDKVFRALRNEGYDCRKYFIYNYAPGLLQEECPNSTWLKERILCLPLYSELRGMHVDAIIQTIKKNIGGR